MTLTPFASIFTRRKGPRCAQPITESTGGPGSDSYRTFTNSLTPSFWRLWPASPLTWPFRPNCCRRLGAGLGGSRKKWSPKRMCALMEIAAVAAAPGSITGEANHARLQIAGGDAQNNGRSRSHEPNSLAPRIIDINSGCPGRKKVCNKPQGPAI